MGPNRWFRNGRSLTNVGQTLLRVATFAAGHGACPGHIIASNPLFMPHFGGLTNPV
jgi:hypothetical protein